MKATPPADSLDALYKGYHGWLLSWLRRRLDCPHNAADMAQDTFTRLLGAGAYGFAMSSNYNSRLRAAEVLVDGDQVHLVRQREQWQDLWRGEQLLPA